MRRESAAARADPFAGHYSKAASLQYLRIKGLTIFPFFPGDLAILVMELWDGRFELKETAKLEGHTDRVWSLAWNPATGVGGIPLVFASCSGDKTVRIWEQSPSSGSWNCKVLFLLSIFVEWTVVRAHVVLDFNVDVIILVYWKLFVELVFLL